MFVQFTDKDGRETWINPLHVKAVREHRGPFGGKKAGAEVWLGGLGPSIIIIQPPADIAAMLDAALPAHLLLPPGDEDDQPPKPAANPATV